MPKGKKKGKFEHRRTEQAMSSDEDAGIDMTIDNCSETSGQSDLKSNHEEAALEETVKRNNGWLRQIACFGGPANRPKRGTDIQISATSVNFKDIATRATNRAAKANRKDEASDSDESDDVPHDEFWHASNTYLTLDSLNPFEDEWDTENDSLNYVEDEHVEVSHQGRPSQGPVRSTNVDSDTLDPGAGLDRCPSGPSYSTIPQDKHEAQEKLEEKVCSLVEALGARAAAARAAAMVSLRAALQRRPVAGALAAHRATLADHVARALRRGRDQERRAAAALAPILALQIGDEGTEEFMNEVRPALASTAVDRTASLDTRTECCSSLAALCYLLEEDVSEILDILQMYETIFSGSYLKGDGTVNVSAATVEEGAWHASALDAWSLLLGALDEGTARALLRDRPPGRARLAGMLDACALEVRMAAGAALAVAHEHAGAEAAGAEAAGAEAPLGRLEALARDSHKYHAKRDRKLQRATFRDILKYFEEGTVPTLRVRVAGETLSCSSWRERGAYGALAAALGAGLAALLPHSGPLRDALALPDAPLAATAPQRRLNKLQRHLQNTAACKARTVARNKNRDKRSAALAL